MQEACEFNPGCALGANPMIGRDILIYYFSGTGNTLRVAKVVYERLFSKGFNVRLANIENGKDAGHETFSCYGFAYPVYAYGAPRIVANFIRSLPCGDGKASFVLFTMAGWRMKREIATGFILSEIKGILKKKDYKFIGGKAILAPENFSVMYNPPGVELALRIMDRAQIAAEEFIDSLVAGTFRQKKWFLIDYPIWKPIYLFFRLALKLGVVSRLFTVDNRCNGCRICEQVCPVGNIKIVNDRPVWGSICELCFRCINLCPSGAINYTCLTKTRRRYCEPHLELVEVLRRYPGKNSLDNKRL